MIFQGQIFYKNNEGYEEARVGRVFNHKRPERYPEAVFFPLNEADVIEAVKFANEHNHKIAVRAGGHSWAVWSVRETGILLDLKHLNKISLDTQTGIVSAGPATKGGQELNPFLKEHGLFFCGGHCPTVGIGGFLLQGGQGWNARGWGWAVEYIKAIDVVLADGTLVRADENNYADLFWSARGAGPGFFGVVTCFHLQAIPRPKLMYASTYVFPSSCAAKILQWWQEIHGTVSLNIELVAIGQTMPIELRITNYELRIEETDNNNRKSEIVNPKSEIRDVIIVHALVFEKDIETATEALKPFETCPVLDQAYIRREYYETDLAEQLTLQTEANPEGHRWAVNNAWLEGDKAQITETVAPFFVNLPTQKAFSLWYSMAPLRQLPDMAFSMQTEIYYATYLIWEDEADDEKNQNWLKNQVESIKSVVAGQYLGDSDLTKHHRKFMNDENWTKLQKIRTKYDPKGLFHNYACKSEEDLNKNIWE